MFEGAEFQLGKWSKRLQRLRHRVQGKVNALRATELFAYKRLKQ